MAKEIMEKKRETCVQFSILSTLQYIIFILVWENGTKREEGKRRCTTNQKEIIWWKMVFLLLMLLLLFFSFFFFLVARNHPLGIYLIHP